MNTPNDIRWLLFATVPVHRNINLATPIARGFVSLFRRLAGSVQARRQRVTGRRGVPVKPAS